MARSARKAAMALSWVSLCLAILFGVFVTICHCTHLSCWVFHAEPVPDGVSASAYFVQMHWISLQMDSDHRFTSTRLAREHGWTMPTTNGWDIQWWRGTPTHRVSGSSASGSPIPRPTREVHGVPLVWRSIRETHAPLYHEDGSLRSSTTYFDMIIAVWPVQMLLMLTAIPAGVKSWRWSWAMLMKVVSWLNPQRTKGLCPKCGYDLRATPQRCPECGHTADT